MPAWVFADILIGLWVVADIFIRYKGFIATQIRRIAEFVMSLGLWRQS